MAELKVNVEVNGEEDVKKLSDALKETTEDLGRMNTKSVAIGNVLATAFEGGINAFVEIAEAGAEFNRSMEDLNGTLHKTADAEINVSENFSAFAGAILESTGIWKAYSGYLEVINTDLEYFTKLLGGVTAKEKRRLQIKKEVNAELKKESEDFEKWAEQEEEKEQKREERRERRAQEIEKNEIARGKRALSRYNAQQKAKVDAHKEEIKVLEELMQIYEEHGRNTDKLIDKIEKMEQVNVLATKSVRDKADAMFEDTEVTEDNTEATEVNTEATSSNTDATNISTDAIRDNISALRDQRDAQGVGSASTDASSQQGNLAGNGATGTSSAPVVSGAMAYAYGTGIMSYGNVTGDYSRELKKQTAELKKLNNKVG